MSNQSALIGFAVFKMVSGHLRLPFTPQENVVIQTVAGAVGCMPVTAGFTGVIPALEFLISPAEQGPLHLSYLQLLYWSLGVCLIGLIWAMMFRTQLVVRERLPWPGPVATATLISVLHTGGKTGNDIHHNAREESSDDSERTAFIPNGQASAAVRSRSPSKIKALIWAGIGSGLFVCTPITLPSTLRVTDRSLHQTLLTYFVPFFRNVPVFGSYLYQEWLWSINISAGFVGSGIITGPVIPLHMLAGAVVGWAILSPIAKTRRWAPGDVGDWEHGSRGWIMWVSLAALLADCLIKLSWLVIKPVVKSMTIQSFFSTYLAGRDRSQNSYAYSRLAPNPGQDHEADNDSRRSEQREIENEQGPGTELLAPADGTEKDSGGVRFRFLYALLLLAVLICTAAVRYVFGNMISTFVTIVAIAVSLPLSIMGIRAVAETDWNPMSGIGEFSISHSANKTLNPDVSRQNIPANIRIAHSTI
jgi:OPT family oligopeptide transporter